MVSILSMLLLISTSSIEPQVEPDHDRTDPCLAQPVYPDPACYPTRRPIPTFKRTNYPTKGPTHYPIKKATWTWPRPPTTAEPTTAIPTTSPSPRPTTAIPTTSPSPRPTTAIPSTSPSPRPTTPSPTQPDVMSCGEDSIGTYSNSQLIFETSMPFVGALTFDASNSDFTVTNIEAFTKLGSLLGTDLDHDEVITLPTAVAGDYKFIMVGELEGQNTGIYHAKVRCISAEPTRSPTQSPTKDPSEEPSHAPVDHLTTAHPHPEPTTNPSASPFHQPSQDISFSSTDAEPSIDETIHIESTQSHDDVSNDVGTFRMMWVEDYITKHMILFIIAVICLCIVCVLIVVLISNRSKRSTVIHMKVDQNSVTVWSDRNDTVRRRKNSGSDSAVHLKSNDENAQVILPMNDHGELNDKVKAIKTYGIRGSKCEMELPKLPPMKNNDNLYDCVPQQEIQEDGEDSSDSSMFLKYNTNGQIEGYEVESPNI